MPSESVPRIRYTVVDVGQLDERQLARSGNLVAMLFRLGRCWEIGQLKRLVSELVAQLDTEDSESLGRAFAVWVRNLVRARIKSDEVSTMEELLEAQRMLFDALDEWQARSHREGETAMLIRLLRKRFGEVPEPLKARLASAPQEEIDRCSDRLFEARSLKDLFGAEALPARG